MMSSSNPKNWRFTWEAQSHTPTLKLFLFNGGTSLSIHCNTSLSVQLLPSQSQLLVTWLQTHQKGDVDVDVDNTRVSLRVPIPRVLIDPDSPLHFRALDDHIEVKLALLLPVDNPIVSSIYPVSDAVKPLIMDSDLKDLSSRDEVDFYCRKCSFRLTRSPLRNFVEMPSVNWHEVADNWFGGCCCSFGGVSEKLVNKYAHAYACKKGVCSLSPTAVTIYKDDLVGCGFSESDSQKDNKSELHFDCDNGASEGSLVTCGMDHGSIEQCGKVHGLTGKLRCLDINSENLDENLNGVVTGFEADTGVSYCAVQTSSECENVPSSPRCCHSTLCGGDDIDEASTPSLENQKTTQATELMGNQRSFLNGFLGNAFMARSYNLSTDIKWKQYVCPQCSSLLGAYPCATDDVPVDGGVRLLKCYISTSLLGGGSDNLFRSYTLEKMFANQLVESAQDELSFRTLVRDLGTKSPILQVVLLNPNSWCCSGYCSETESITESASKPDLQPVIKVLFSDCTHPTESQSRMLGDWDTKKLADKVYMLTHLVEELIETMSSTKDVLPPSCTFLHGLSLSSMLRTRIALLKYVENQPFHVAIEYVESQPFMLLLFRRDLRQRATRKLRCSWAIDMLSSRSEEIGTDCTHLGEEVISCKRGILLINRLLCK